MSEFPTRPSDISQYLSLAELAERANEHLWPQLRSPDHPDTVAHRLAWLAYRTELADRAAHGRYVTAVDALSAGATIKQVADAVGMRDYRVPEEIRLWAAGQRCEGLMTVARYVEVLDLIGEVPE